MFEVHKSKEFGDWLDALTDKIGRARIQARLLRIETSGLFGDCEPVGDGVHELRIDHGPGYRCYFYHEGFRVIFIVKGGDKTSQKRDINAVKKAKVVKEAEAAEAANASKAVEASKAGKTAKVGKNSKRGKK